MERRKLFSTSEPRARRKLFSDESVKTNGLQELICMDCGFRTSSFANPTTMLCPKCGGKRFEVVKMTISPIQAEKKVEPYETVSRGEEKSLDSRRSVLNETEESYQRAFSYTTDELELKLKEFSGKTLSSEEFEKEFGKTCTATELEDRSFCTIGEDGDIAIDKDAFVRSRMFSKIIVSVTRELDLDPEIVGCKDPFKREMIEGFSRDDRFCPRGIMILKKGHSLPLDEENNAWLHDSGICCDLKSEFGGTHPSIEEFKRTLDERYPDAPEDIVELLKKKGIIGEEANGVIEIFK